MCPWLTLRFLLRPLPIDDCQLPSPHTHVPMECACGIGAAHKAVLPPAGTILAYPVPSVRYHCRGAVFFAFFSKPRNGGAGRPSRAAFRPASPEKHTITHNCGLQFRGVYPKHGICPFRCYKPRGCALGCLNYRHQILRASADRRHDNHHGNRRHVYPAMEGGIPVNSLRGCSFCVLHLPGPSGQMTLCAAYN